MYVCSYGRIVIANTKKNCDEAHGKDSHAWAEIEVIKNKMDVDGVWMLKIMKTDSAYV